MLFRGVFFLLLLIAIQFLDKVELRKVQALASEARAQAQMKTKIADAKKKYVSLEHVTRKYVFLK